MKFFKINIKKQNFNKYKLIILIFIILTIIAFLRFYKPETFNTETPEIVYDYDLLLAESDSSFNSGINNNLTDEEREELMAHYTDIKNELDTLLYFDNKSQLTPKLENKIINLPVSLKENLCNDYCQLYGGCSPLCKLLNCSNCINEDNTNSNIYRQPDELEQNMVPRTSDNTHIDDPDIDYNIKQESNGDTNIFAPYIVIHKKKNKGEQYKPYVMSNPYDPHYYSYINNLS